MVGSLPAKLHDLGLNLGIFVVRSLLMMVVCLNFGMGRASSQHKLLFTKTKK